MKKLLFGLALFMTGGLSSIILVAGAMQRIEESDGYFRSVWLTLGRYHVAPLFWAMVVMAAGGLILALWAMRSKE